MFPAHLRITEQQVSTSARIRVREDAWAKPSKTGTFFVPGQPGQQQETDYSPQRDKKRHD